MPNLMKEYYDLYNEKRNIEFDIYHTVSKVNKKRDELIKQEKELKRLENKMKDINNSLNKFKLTKE